MFSKSVIAAVSGTEFNPLGIEAVIKASADLLLQNQNNDGGWDAVLGDNDPASASDAGIIGATALGLLRAKNVDLTMAGSYQKAASMAGEYLCRLDPNDLTSLDAIFLYYLHRETDDPKYSDQAEAAMSKAETRYSALINMYDEETLLWNLGNLIEAGKLITSDFWPNTLIDQILSQENNHYDPNTGSFIYADSNDNVRLLGQAKMVEVLKRYSFAAYHANYLAAAKQFLLDLQVTEEDASSDTLIEGSFSWAAQIDDDYLVQDQACALRALSYYDADVLDPNNSSRTYMAAQALQEIVTIYLTTDSLQPENLGQAILSLFNLLPEIKSNDTTTVLDMYQGKTATYTFDWNMINSILDHSGTTGVGSEFFLKELDFSGGWIILSGSDPNAPIVSIIVASGQGPGIYKYDLKAENIYGKSAFRKGVNVLPSPAVNPLGRIMDEQGMALDPNSFFIAFSDPNTGALSFSRINYISESREFYIDDFVYGRYCVNFLDTEGGIAYKDIQCVQEFTPHGYVEIIGREIKNYQDIDINVSVANVHNSPLIIDIYDVESAEMIYSSSITVTDPNAVIATSFPVSEKKHYSISAHNEENFQSTELTGDDNYDTPVVFEFSLATEVEIAEMEQEAPDQGGLDDFVTVPVTGRQLATKTMITITNIVAPKFRLYGQETDTEEIDLTFEPRLLSLPAFMDGNAPIDPNTSVSVNISYSNSSLITGGVGEITGPGCSVVKIEFKDDSGTMLIYNPQESDDVQPIELFIPLPRALQNPDFFIEEIDAKLIKTRQQEYNRDLYGVYYMSYGTTDPQIFVAESFGESIKAVKRGGYNFAMVRAKRAGTWFVQHAALILPTLDDMHWYECFIGTIHSPHISFTE
ncbi:MAG: hypothetical protein ACMUJM_19535 [bacterium]